MVNNNADELAGYQVLNSTLLYTPGHRCRKKKTTNTSDPIIFFSFKSVLWAFIIQLLILLIHTIDILHYHNYVTYFLLDMHGLNERRLENIKRSQRNDVICYIFSSTIKLEYMYNIYQFMA